MTAHKWAANIVIIIGYAKFYRLFMLFFLNHYAFLSFVTNKA